MEILFILTVLANFAQIATFPIAQNTITSAPASSGSGPAFNVTATGTAETIAPPTSQSQSPSGSGNGNQVFENNACLSSNRLCISSTPTNFTNFKLYFPSSIFPIQTNFNDLTLNLYQGNSSIFQTLSPCEIIPSNLIISQNLKENSFVKETSSSTWTEIQFDNVDGSGNVIPENDLKALLDGQDSLFLQLFDKDKRQCILGPDLSGSFSLGFTFDKNTTAKQGSADGSNHDTKAPTDNNGNNNNTNSNADQSHNLNLIRILIACLVATFVIFSTLLIYCFYSRRKERNDSLKRKPSSAVAPLWSTQIFRDVNDPASNRKRPSEEEEDLGFLLYRLPSLKSVNSDDSKDLDLEIQTTRHGKLSDGLRSPGVNIESVIGSIDGHSVLGSNLGIAHSANLVESLRQEPSSPRNNETSSQGFRKEMGGIYESSEGTTALDARNTTPSPTPSGQKSEGGSMGTVKASDFANPETIIESKLVESFYS